MIFYKQSNARRTAVEAKSNRSQVVNTALAHFRSKLIWSALDVTYTSRYNRLILGLNYSINRYKYYLTNIYVVDEKFGSEKKILRVSLCILFARCDWRRLSAQFVMLPPPRVRALSDDARLTSVWRLSVFREHRASSREQRGLGRAGVYSY